ncbi:hypothetical protein ACHAXM_011299 [Skeletonema potamos]
MILFSTKGLLWKQYLFRSWTPSPSAKRERIGSDEKSSGLEARLRRVENLLERLASESGSIISKPMSLMDDSCLLGHSGNEYADIGSTKLSFGGLSNRDTEVESLQREILALRQQLYANKLGTVVEGTTAQEGIAQTTLVDRLTSKPKLKARVKRLFRGKKGS